MNEQKIQTLGELILQAGREFGSRASLGFVGEDPWSYEEVLGTAYTAAGTLKDEGVSLGTKVALLSESSPLWGTAYFAGVLCGAVLVPILPDFHANEIEGILTHSKAEVLIVSSKMRGKISQIPSGVKLLVVEELLETRTIAEPDSIVLPQVSGDDTACIIYTSGTTGSSKGVMLSHRNILVNAFAAEKIPNWTEENHALSVLPLAHTYEFTIGFIILIIKGGTIFYLKRPPSTSVLLPALATVKPHIMLSVPLLIEKIYEGIKKTKIDTKLILKTLYRIPLTRRLINRKIGKQLYQTFGGRLHFFGIGGAPLTKETERFLREASFPFSIGYGLTETSPLIAGGLGPQIPFGSTGPVLPNLEYRFKSHENYADGELQVRGPSIMQGYYNDPQKTSEVLSEDGWFSTGDLGRIEQDGSLSITGRAKTMILGSSGENIYPEQIEAVINADEYVAESLVLQDPKDGSLLARVVPDYERFQADIQKEGKLLKEIHNLERQLLHQKEQTPEQRIEEYLQNLKGRVNKELSAYSRLSTVIEQKEPFERTPTKKIKRYLYTV